MGGNAYLAVIYGDPSIRKLTERSVKRAGRHGKTRGIVFFCSGNARESQFMAIELEIAKSYKLRKPRPRRIALQEVKATAQLSLIVTTECFEAEGNLGSSLPF